jgi:tyrosinase
VSAANDVIDALEASTGKQPAHKVLGLTRRQLGVLAGLIGAGGVGLACTQTQLEELIEQIRNRPVRRNANTMAADNPVLVSYAAAIEEMQDLAASDPRNWTRQAQIHQTFCRHHNWLFLPWHRAYLFYFEQICRELSGDDDFALPYWNWTTEQRVPAPFWDTASPLYHEPRVAGANSTASVNQVGQANIDNVLATNNFILFAGAAVAQDHPPNFGPGMAPLESGPHNHIHNFVGGTMASFLSPEDPIFWLHHCRVDELWVQWNVTDGNPNTNDSDWTNTQFTEFVDRNGDQVNVSVAVTTLWPLLSYRYDTQTGA